jgi:hypothetical protein
MDFRFELGVVVGKIFLSFQAGGDGAAMVRKEVSLFLSNSL